nr:MAG TPA: hypothetical protein [Caudoviricetes sp.]
MQPLNGFPPGDLPIAVFLVDFCHSFDFFIYGQRPRRKIVILSENRNFIVHFALSLYGRIGVLSRCGPNAPQVDGNRRIFASVSAAVRIDDNRNRTLFSLACQNGEINIGNDYFLSDSVGNIDTEAVILERISDISISGDREGALGPGFGSREAGSNVLLVLSHGVHLRVKSRNTLLYHGVVFFTCGLSNTNRKDPVVICGKPFKFIIGSISSHQLRYFHDSFTPFV